MELVPWRPFGEVSSLRKEMDNLWNHFLGETSFPRSLTQEWLPSVDVSETANKLLIRAKLPGMDLKDVSVSISGEMLTIKGEKQQEDGRKEEQYHSSERYFGYFQRSFRPPANIKNDEVDETLNANAIFFMSGP